MSQLHALRDWLVDLAHREKACSVCGESKLYIHFRIRRGAPDGREGVCRDCAKVQDARHRELGKATGALHRAQIMYRYGVTPEEFDAMLARQAGLCAACREPESREGYRLSVDHCHETGVVRGLLCDRCNTALGRVNDDPARLMALIAYLYRGTNTRPDFDTYFLTLAQAISLRGDCRRRRHGCVIVDSDRRVVGLGYNGAPVGEPGCLSGACPRGLLGYDDVASLSDYDSGPGRCISVHAEANALLYARASCKGATAYITGEPCPTCHKLMTAAGIERIVYP